MYTFGVIGSLGLIAYLFESWLVRSRLRQRRDGDDPFERAYAGRLAAAEQTGALMHTWLMMACVFLGGPGVLTDSVWVAIPLSIGMISASHVLVNRWVHRRHRSILNS